MASYSIQPRNKRSKALKVFCEGCDRCFWKSPSFFNRSKHHYCSTECVMGKELSKETKKTYADYLREYE